ncbi:MAG: Do family serine endopeptidase [bacterium]
MKINNMLLTFVIALPILLTFGCVGGDSAAKGTTSSQADTVFMDEHRVSSIPESPFVEVAQKVVAGVVSIDTKRSVETSFSFDFDEPFSRLFGNLIPDLGPKRYEMPGYASGFIFDERGYVVTNHHVIKDAEEVIVRLHDGREYEAEIVGSDVNTDIAVLKISGEDRLPVVKLGDSDEIRVGDWALAVGNPFGRLEGTVTVGVISAKGRSALSIMGGTPALQDFIQTDASINFGNSGGPLVNIKGEAIGMNTAINPLGQGIGFAIPINLVKRVAEEIIRHGKVAWGYLGILPQEINRNLAETLGVEPKSGILVGSVVEASPADRAGLKQGDIIVKFDGEPVSNVDQFRLKVAEAGVGKRVSIEFLRDGKRKKIEVTLGERPAEVASGPRGEKGNKWLGLTVDDLTGASGKQYAPEGVTSGVVVVRVEMGSGAEEAGIRPGDVIDEINQINIENLRDYNRAIERIKDLSKPVRLHLIRENVGLYVAVKPE